MKVSLDHYAMSNAILFVNASIHQGDRRFSDVSRGRRCAFMSLSPLLCANSCDVRNGRPTQLISY